MPKVSASANVVAAQSTAKEYGKLLAIYAGIALTATLMSYVVGFSWQEWMRWFMGGFFVLFGAFKLIGYEMFVVMFPSYDLVAAKYRAYAYFYPFIELFLGGLYFFNLGGFGRDVLTLAIMLVGARGVLRNLHARRRPALHCACLGNVVKLPLTTVTVFEDLLMAAMAAIMIVATITS